MQTNDVRFGERITVRVLDGTTRKAKRFMKSFPGRWQNIAHFYRSAIYQFERNIGAELFERRLDEAHERRLLRMLSGGDKHG
jgi:hypothetical protein